MNNEHFIRERRTCNQTSRISGVGVEMRGEHRFLSFLRNVRKENQRNAVKFDEKVGENKETQKFKEEISVCDQAIPILINAIERDRERRSHEENTELRLRETKRHRRRNNELELECYVISMIAELRFVFGENEIVRDLRERACDK